jgi:hypothetical protein
MEKPAKDMFDPKNFLAKVGTEKQYWNFTRISTCTSKVMSLTRCFIFKTVRSSLQLWSR